MLQPCVGVQMYVCVCACACFAAGCKAAPNVHLPSSQSTWAHNMHMCTPTPPNTHAQTQTICTHSTQAHAETRHSPEPQKLSAYLYSHAECFPCFCFTLNDLHSHSHLHKNIPPFLKLSPWCSCNTRCDINITSFLTRIQKCTYTYFTTGVKRSMGEKEGIQRNSPNT